MKSELELLKGNIEIAIIKNDDLEQYSRISCLRMAGIPEEDQTEQTIKVPHGLSLLLTIFR